MKKIFTAIPTFIPALFAAGSIVHAEPATFANGEMTIPEGAVISGDGNAYYTDITLAYDGNGSLVITGAEANSLVNVETVDVMIMESFPVQVSLSVSGNLSVPCVELQEPAVSVSGNVFNIVLAESNLGPAESCIAVLEPFETNVSLDVQGLSAGTYTVDVNGVTAEFTLDVDNTPLGQ